LRLALYRRWLDDFDDPHPAAEWGLRWLELEKPAATEIVLLHGDFRTGNYLIDGDRLAAILDWEFASLGDPHEDIGWFCCKSWRFGALDREAGGLVPRATFYRAYEEHSGRSLDPRHLHYWEVMASLRWLILALQQRDRFLRGGERSLALALTGRRPAECEFELLRLIEAGRL
jgi:aminoglycoside phosphotransferase (APT) family kinase protein